MGRIKKPQNLYSALFSIIIGLTVIALSRNIHALSMADPLGPSRYPMLLGIIVTILGATLFVPSIAGKGEGIEGKAESLSFVDIIPLLIVLAWCIFYIFAVERLGFVLTNTLLLLGCLVSLGERNILKMLVFSLATAVALYCMFRIVLGIPLPTMPFLDI